MQYLHNRSSVIVVVNRHLTANNCCCYLLMNFLLLVVRMGLQMHGIRWFHLHSASLHTLYTQSLLHRPIVRYGFDVSPIMVTIISKRKRFGSQGIKAAG